MSHSFGISNPAVLEVSQASNLVRSADPQVAPVAASQSTSTLEDTAVNIVLTASDANGDLLSYAVVDGPSNGSLTGTAPNLIYTPNANYNGSDSFTFKANDGTADSAIATVSITVTAVNDAPVADAQSVSVDHNTATAITLTGSDVEGSALTYTVVTNPTNGSLTGTAPSLTYTPNSGYSGSDSFTFTVNDGTADSSAATVTLTVAAAAVDASFANVSLLLKADGANNSTSFVDSSTNNFAISRFGNTKISTDDSKYGGSSAFFDGNGDYLSVANNAAFSFGSGDFTIEMWVSPTAPSSWSQKHLFAKRATTSNFGLLSYITRNTVTGLYAVTVFIPNAAGNGWAISKNVPISFTGWTHFALVRSGNEWSVYINGVKDVLNANLSITVPSNTAALTIGADSAAGTGTSGYVGYMDDIRITKGVARYTANFTPPPAHPTSGS